MDTFVDVLCIAILRMTRLDLFYIIYFYSYMNNVATEMHTPVCCRQ